MKKKDISKFFEKLEVKHGSSLCSSFLRRNLEANFDSIPRKELGGVLDFYEDIYKSSVIFKPNKEGFKAAEKYAKNIGIFLEGMHYIERRLGVLDSTINNLYKGIKNKAQHRVSGKPYIFQAWDGSEQKNLNILFFIKNQIGKENN